MHFKRDCYVCGYQNKYGKKACPDNFRPVESDLKKLVLDDLNALCFKSLNHSSIEKLIDTELQKDLEKQSKETTTIQKELMQLRNRKDKALEKLLDEKISQEDYDNFLSKLNPQIESLVDKLKTLKTNEVETNVTLDELKLYLLKQLNPKKPISKLTPTILAKFIHKITVKADGQLEVRYQHF